MKKFFLILSAMLAFTACSAQYVINGRLQIKSGTRLNSVIAGADTLYYGWNAHTFSFYDKDTNKILEFGLADTAKFYSNLKFSSAYTNGTIYWPNSNNSYIKGNALYFLHGSEFLQAIPTQLKISASTHNYATLNSYRLLFNKAAGVFIQNDTNGVLMYGTDYAVRDDAGFEYLRHNYGDSTTTISNLTVSSAAADTAVVINGDVKANDCYLNTAYFNNPESYVSDNEILITDVNTGDGFQINIDGITFSKGISLFNDSLYFANDYFIISGLGKQFLLFDHVNNRITAKQNIIAEKGLQVGNDATAASAANVGAIRYRSDANNSYCEMVMQTGASSYAWVVIKQNTW